MRIYLTVIVILTALQAYPQEQRSGNPADSTHQSATTSLQADDSGDKSAPTVVVTPAEFSGAVGDSETPMLTPAPVSTIGYSMDFSSGTPKTNYISGGLIISSAYDDRVVVSANGQPLTDISYSVRPTFLWNKSTPRLLGKLFYRPGFSFYQRNSSLNQSDQNLLLQTAYRLSPQVTVTLQDTFYKTSNPLSLLEQSARVPTGATQTPVATVISTLANQITNHGSAQITYQFAPNGMIGASGEFSGLYYLNSNQVAGLFDSRSRAAQGFYSHKLTGRQYIGARYEYQNLVSIPNGSQTQTRSQTQTNSVVFFYTLYVQPSTSISFFAGPQHSNSYSGDLISAKLWSPTYGASFGWQGRYTSLALSAGRSISAGGGLQGAVRSVSANASVRRQLAKTLNAGLSAYYSKNTALQILPQSSDGGHTISETVSLDRQVRENLNLTLAYTGVQQSYSNIAPVSSAPNQNRVSLSLSYQFTRPIGQ
jgi:hypothetical protein